MLLMAALIGLYTFAHVWTNGYRKRYLEQKGSTMDNYSFVAALQRAGDEVVQFERAQKGMTIADQCHYGLGLIFTKKGGIFRLHGDGDDFEVSEVAVTVR